MYHITRANMEYAYEIDVRVQSGGDAQDALNRRSLSAKEPLFIELFCRKRHIQIRHLMCLCHPAADCCVAADCKGTWDMTYWYVGHDSFVMRDVTHAYAADVCVANIYTHYQHIHTFRIYRKCTCTHTEDACVANIYTHCQHIHTFRIYRIYTSTHTENMHTHFAYTHLCIHHMTHAYAVDAYVSNHEKMRSGIK